MEIPPPISYATREGASLAFQTFGDGAVPLIIVTDPPSHLDLLWTDPGYVDVLMRMTGAVRATMFDRRGTGLSDPLEHVPTLEEEALDLEAVMNAAGVERGVLFGYLTSSLTAAYFAATRPERVDRLALLATYARGWEVEGHLWSPEQREAARTQLADALDHWGEGRLLSLVIPALDSPRNRRLWGLLERASSSRAAARATWQRAVSLDLTEVLPSIQAPTLLLRHADNPMPAPVMEEVARLIPDSTLRTVHFRGSPTGVADFWLPITDEIEEFITGTRTAAAASQKMVATLLFTDIVGSTAHAARLGDSEWRSLLSRHDGLLLGILEEEGGRLIKNVGDGSLSSFDGPVRAIRCAQRLGQELEPLGLQVRCGVHTGECERVGLDVAGMAVHVGARVEATAQPGQVLVTRAASELCGGSGIDFTPCGTHELKGVPGSWELFSVGSAAGTPATITAEHAPMRMADRLVLKLARRAPGLLRGAARRGAA